MLHNERQNWDQVEDYDRCGFKVKKIVWYFLFMIQLIPKKVVFLLPKFTLG
jgi:hypothetical protein